MIDKDRGNQFLDADLKGSNLKTKSVRGGIVTLLCQATDAFLRIASVAILARILMPADFGLVSMVTAITAIAEQFKDIGLSTATVQKKIITQEQVSKLFWINVLAGLGITSLISASSVLIAMFFHEDRLIYIALAIATGFLWSGVTIQHQAILRRQMKYATIGGIQIGSTVISAGIATILAFGGYGYWALVWREVLRSVFIALGTWILCPWRPDMPRRNINIEHLMEFGRHITGFNAIVFLTASVDQLLIGKIYGAAQLGIYRQAYQLIWWPVMQLTVPLSRVAESALSFLQDNEARYRKVYQKLLTTVNLVVMPVILFSVVYSNEIVSVVLGEKWIEAAPMFRIFGIAAFIAPSSDTTGLLLMTCGKTKRYLNLGLATGLILLLSFGIGVVWGALGVAYGFVVATYTLLVLRLYCSFEGTPVTVGAFWTAIDRPLVASGAMMMVLVMTNSLVSVNSPLSQLIIAAPVAVVTYLCVWIVMPGGKEKLAEIAHDMSASLDLERRYDARMNARGKRARVF